MHMWMVNPRLMCDKHLLGEHVECHMLAGSLRKGKSIQGFIARNLLEPQNLKSRHQALASEMTNRGFNHKSELAPYAMREHHIGSVDVDHSLKELAARCHNCAAIIGAKNDLV